jgi:hypothetical protein
MNSLQGFYVLAENRVFSWPFRNQQKNPVDSHGEVHSSTILVNMQSTPIILIALTGSRVHKFPVYVIAISTQKNRNKERKKNLICLSRISRVGTLTGSRPPQSQIAAGAQAGRGVAMGG